MLTSESEIERRAPRSTDPYPGMRPIARPRKSHTLEVPERLFVVIRKNGIEEILAETVQIADSGALIFKNGNDLVRAIAAHAWTDLEEGEVE